MPLNHWENKICLIINMVIINRSKKWDLKQKVASSKNNTKSNTKSKTFISPVFDPYGVLLAPLSTEKSIRQIEFENKIVFIVGALATKKEVKKAVEELFKVKVLKVNIQNSFTGQRRAYVRLTKAYLASDISADLGLI